MKVKDLHIDGFGVWTGLSVDSLPDTMTLFYGPNEAGKTTVMQFLRAMLYGFTTDRREKYLPPVHGGTPGGAVRVTGPGGGYQIRRHLQMTSTSEVGQLTVTGQDGLAQGQHRLSMLLGQIDEAIFTNVFAIGMRELQELSTLDDTSAADELYKLSSGLDRVSLVDVIRSLRAGRKSLIGESTQSRVADEAKLESLLERRDQLRDEAQTLSSHSRRWSEFATQRRTQQQEIDDLSARIGDWEKETRIVECALNVCEKWSERSSILKEIRQIETEAQLPEDAPGQLVQIEAMIQDRRKRLEEVKDKRRALREKVAQLPVSQRLVDLQGRIEAAIEQATWVEALEEQIDKVDGQILKAQSQLAADAERMGLGEEDREALASGDLSQMPDLSRQTLTALGGPAKRVKEQHFLLKQAREEGREFQAQINELQEGLGEVLHRVGESDLQQAIRSEQQTLARLQRSMQLGEHIEKLKRHYRSLENESANLSVSEVVPLDRLIFMGAQFAAGACCLIIALSHFIGFTWLLFSEPNPTEGVPWLIFGLMTLIIFYYSKQNTRSANSADREDCERQIDSLRKQIREVEAEKEEIDSDLPSSSHPIEYRVRQSELLIVDLETALPTYHAHAAASQSYETVRAKAVKAAENLRGARREWSATLRKLGMSDSLSPRSVRNLSDGYETLQLSLKRLEELRSEKEQRVRERQNLAKRIELLYLESLEISQQDLGSGDPADDAEEREDAEFKTERIAETRRRALVGPLEQLNHLQEEIARQQHWIKRRREFKEQDQQLKRHQAAHARTIERGEQQRRALWAKCGVATAEQFYEMVDANTHLIDLRKDSDRLDAEIRSMVPAAVKHEHVDSLLVDSTQADLEARWNALTKDIGDTQERIATLQTQQGELAAEMKHLSENNRLASVKIELGCVNRKIESLAKRWQTLATASHLVEEVCRKFERERQPETLREASSFLKQLTDGKYDRIWTPLGTNQLKIDGADGKSLPLEVLSRGTREAVFIALRLSLAAAYARRGVMLPLVLDDVLVNFDGDRATHAAVTLKTFAELGHQVMMFTCHEHIVDIFQAIGVEVRQLPAQGQPGRATVLLDEHAALDEEPFEEDLQTEVANDEQQEVEALDEIVAEEPAEEVVEETTVEELEEEMAPVLRLRKTPRRTPIPRPQRSPERTDTQVQANPSALDWAWFEREPADGKIDDDELAAESLTAAHRVVSDELLEGEVGVSEIPEEIWERNHADWDGSRQAM